MKFQSAPGLCRAAGRFAFVGGLGGSLVVQGREAVQPSCLRLSGAERSASRFDQTNFASCCGCIECGAADPQARASGRDGVCQGVGMYGHVVGSFWPITNGPEEHLTGADGEILAPKVDFEFYRAELEFKARPVRGWMPQRTFAASRLSF